MFSLIDSLIVHTAPREGQCNSPARKSLVFGDLDGKIVRESFTPAEAGTFGAPVLPPERRGRNSSGNPLTDPAAGKVASNPIPSFRFEHVLAESQLAEDRLRAAHLLKASGELR